MKKIYRFTEYRINHVRNRRSGLGGTLLSRQIDHLHNLRLQLDRRLRKHPNKYKKRNYYQPVPRSKGGYDTEGQATCHHQPPSGQVKTACKTCSYLSFYDKRQRTYG